MRWTVPFVVFLAAATPLVAEPLVTDRPDQTESALTVPPGAWQLEFGLLHGENDDAGVETRENAFGQTLVRHGLTERLELRLGLDGYRDVEISGSDLDGFGDASLGLKTVLWREDGLRPQIALLGGLTLPVGEDGLSSEEADPSFRLLFSNGLTERLSLGYNVGAAWSSSEISPGVTETRSVAVWTASLGIGITERLGAFVELFGETGLSAGGPPANALDSGVTWLLHDNLQLDFSVGAGLSDAADDWFAGVGLSYRHLPQ